MAEKLLTKGELKLSVPYEEIESPFTLFKLLDEKGLFGVPIILDQDDQRISVYEAAVETRGLEPEESLPQKGAARGSYLAPVSPRDVIEKVRRRMEEGGHFVYDLPLDQVGRSIEAFAFFMHHGQRFFRFALRPLDTDYRVVGLQGHEIQKGERFGWSDVSTDPLGRFDRLRRPLAA